MELGDHVGPIPEADPDKVEFFRAYFKNEEGSASLEISTDVSRHSPCPPTTAALGLLDSLGCQVLTALMNL
jgi:hypothetical protein